MKLKPRYQPGDKIGGRYQVHQALMGGMGEVYLCLDLETIQPYALKTFQQRYLTNPKLRAAFENEVATWIALEKHPNIVRCFYMDILDNQPFMILEWIAGDESRGTDLRSWLGRDPLDLRLALDFTIDICCGLIHAGQKQPGLVHRDLKPDNILVAQGRLAKITDFGLAQIVQAADLEIARAESEASGRQSLLGQGGIVGTPPYMAPEQWRGETLDARTDIYAMGCILYELLTVNWPFQATTLDSLRRQHLEADIPKLANRQPLPGSLDTLLARCLAKRCEERFASVDDLLQQLALIYQQQFAATPKAIPISGKFTAIDCTNRGATYARLQRHTEALVDFTSAIDLDPAYAPAYTNRGNTYSILHDYDKALLDHNRAIELDPTDALAYNNRGITYAKLRRHEEALTDFDQAIQLAPAFAGAYANRGITYDDGLDRYNEALVDHNHAIQLDPTNAQWYVNRGNTYVSLQRYVEALADYTHTIQLNPLFTQAYINRGAISTKLGRHQEALIDYVQAIQLDPNDAHVYNNRGNVYARLQRYDEALADQTRAIQLDSNDAEMYFNRGNTYEQLDRYDEAMADYTHAVQLDPTLKQAYLRIGFLLASHNAKQEALPYFEKAAQLGLLRGAHYAQLAKRELGIASPSEADPAQLLYDLLNALLQTGSLSEMRQVVARLPYIMDPEFIEGVKQLMNWNEVPPQYQPAFEQRLAWLRQIANEQKREERDL